MKREYTNLAYSCNAKLAVPQFFPLSQYMPMGYLDRLVRLRKEKGLTQNALAEIIGVEQSTIQRWERGKREPDFAQLFALAEALDVSPGAILDPSIAVPLGPRLFVKGDVAAGVWKLAFEYPETEWKEFTGRTGVSADLKHRFGLKVVGDSMNEVYPEGTILECVSTFGHVEPTPGKKVIVVRTNTDGEVEATVKELVEQDNDLWLRPRSTNPIHQPIRLRDEAPDIVETRIAAVVVASIRPE